MHNLFYWEGGRNIKLEVRAKAPSVRYDMIRYGIFRVYEYFYNLVISKVIINILLCNSIWI